MLESPEKIGKAEQNAGRRTAAFSCLLVVSQKSAALLDAADRWPAVIAAGGAVRLTAHGEGGTAGGRKIG